MVITLARTTNIDDEEISLETVGVLPDWSYEWLVPNEMQSRQVYTYQILL